ncbi:flagellar FliJ protein [Marinitoga hydrogenitolerans DSM 16785]|uniref:Flagellar FliJ protein n=1 Tax=Marinitoga hydrogenitolerans (strain DSM 16785 / JCM 12826 / AT1271) TaxID=1122195 RepID=A0A1M4YNL1_MARH1|nr:flagellar export protein FliJ [Marinitoga hydrogenitolerans]SHF07092.1 flagellar FliJ protein [Marinitoga hydrogenitolerans DSM 16785]
MRFHFNLERLKNLRERLEEEAKRIFLEATAERIKSEQDLVDINNKIKLENENFIKQISNNLITIQEIQQWRSYLESLEKERIRLGEIYREKVAIEEEKRQKYLEARKERIILEKLKERKFEEYKIEYQREENRNLDEIGIQMFYRKKE